MSSPTGEDIEWNLGLSGVPTSDANESALYTKEELEGAQPLLELLLNQPGDHVSDDFVGSMIGSGFQSRVWRDELDQRLGRYPAQAIIDDLIQIVGAK